MMLDFKDIPFFDDHTHLIDVSNHEIDMREFLTPFAHGYGDRLNETKEFGDCVNNDHNSCSDEYLEIVAKNLGVTKTLIKYLSDYYGCETDFDVVLKERNKRSLKDMKAYTAELYADQHIIGELLDNKKEMGDKSLEVFPVPIYRLWRIDAPIIRYFKEAESYDELLEKIDKAVRKAIVEEKYDGVKCHILEKTEKRPHIVRAEEARAVYDRAKKGDKDAYDDVYHALFTHVCKLTMELDFPIHIHTGITGPTYHGDIGQLDPFVFCPMLNNYEFYNTHLVFLHCSYPYARNVGVMANTYPHVWADLGQVLPWACLNFTQILEEIMAMAPHTKILLGTGMHDHPEIAWMSAKVARDSLQVILQKAVDMKMLSEKQAYESAEDIMYKNALRLYGTKA